MKVERSEPIPKPQKYPCLKVAPITNRIVFFTAPQTGTCITNECGDIGKHSKDWDENGFAPFTGSITLQND